MSLNNRVATKKRESTETTIRLSLKLDGIGKTSIKTGFGLFDHMLALTFFWANMDLDLVCNGDLYIDAHHSVEDTGIVLGQAFLEALGDRKGIARAGFGRIPMDEALAEVSLDLSGRPWIEWRGDDLLPPVLAGQEKDIWREFYKTFAYNGRFNLHISFLYGKNGHHLLESAAKGLGIALRQAVLRDGTAIRSTKGGLD